MAVSVYTGTMGSGKTYEAVKHVICPQLAAGRNVVTNIDGIDPVVIRNYVSAKFKKHLDQVGKILVVSRDDAEKPDFFPAWSGSGEEYTAGPYVQPGDLVVIDEAIRFFGSDTKILPRVQAFFREHRHLTNDKGLASDIVLLTQHATDLARRVTNVVDFTWRCKKLKAIGLHSGYVVSVWDGRIRGKPFKTERRIYDKAIFPIYKSYAGGSGTEKDTDNRTNVLKSFKFWAVLIALPISAVVLIWWIKSHFFALAGPSNARAGAAALAAGNGNTIDGKGKFNASGADTPQTKTTQWEILGTFESGIERVVVERSGNQTRVVSLSSCQTFYSFIASCKNDDGSTSYPWAAADSDATPSGKL